MANHTVRRLAHLGTHKIKASVARRAIKTGLLIRFLSSNQFCHSPTAGSDVRAALI
jgi:hypothetical protein